MNLYFIFRCKSTKIREEIKKELTKARSTNRDNTDEIILRALKKLTTN